MNFLLKFFTLILIAFIRIYQIFISTPLQYFFGMPACCRYSPTCSQYALESIKYHGILRGLLLGALRISRCHPWGGSGEDPVPVFSNKKWLMRSTAKN